MRNIITLTTFCFFSTKLISQDTIVKLNGSNIIANITLVTPDIIKYKTESAKHNQTLLTKYVAYVKFKNGKFEPIKKTQKNNLVGSDTLSKPKKTKPLSPLDEPDYKKHRLSFSINAFLLITKEAALHIDYCNNYKHSFGLSIGYEYPNPVISGLLFHFNSLDPIRAYNGIVARINYKNYFTHSRKLYWSPQLVYKSLHYKNAAFGEDDNHGGKKYTYRKETATILGFDSRFGYHILAPQSKYNMETFVGIGYRHRTRDYTVLGREFGQYKCKMFYPDGSKYHKEEDYPIFLLGFKVGINKFFK